MIEVRVTVEHKGKTYLTNVLAKKGTRNEEVLRVAQQQVQQQWGTA